MKHKELCSSELFEALREMLERNHHCSACPHDKAGDCKGCVGERAHDALRKAAGNEVENDLADPQPVRPPDVQGGVDLSYKNLTALPLQAENVGGDFSCTDNKLMSLDGAPETVGMMFYCNNNQLTSLAGAPKTVGGVFDCRNNQLTSLDGAPVKVGGIVFFDGNPGLTQQQIDDYKAFLAAGGNDPAHIDATGHYCEKAREVEVAK